MVKVPGGAYNPRMADLVAAVRASDRAHGLFAEGERVVVGLSGGPDSVALAHALAAYAPERRLALHVAHLDHLLRDESGADGAHAAALADRLELLASLEARDVRALAADLGRGLEDAARAARYAFLAAVAARTAASAVAVGHQADDQAETVVMNFVRGSGLAGLAGMAPRAAYPLAAAEIEALADLVRPPVGAGPPWPPRLVRPLLAVTRAEIEAYLAAHGLEARRDPTNADPAFLRNRVRREVLPALEALNPGLRETLARNARVIAADLAWLEAATDAAWAAVARVAETSVAFARPEWDRLPPALQGRLLRRAAARLGVAGRDFGADAVAAACRLADDGGAGPVALPGGLAASFDASALALARVRPAIPPPHLSPEPVALAVPGEVRLPGGWAIAAALGGRAPTDPPPPGDPWRATLDVDRLPAALAVRGRRAGDRLQPAGMGGRHKSVQDLFVDNHVPRHERDGWPIVVAGEEIVWVPGQRLAERGRVRADTRRVVVLTARPPDRLAVS